tara:strand:+ start:1367 stop:1513 length:147 start_codon:yes stop_codon:yes gene_type:complete
MKINIELDSDQVDKVIIKDLRWHYKYAEDIEDKRALKKVLAYYGVKRP